MTVFSTVIPARLDSTRLPRKLLADVAGRSVLEHTWRRARESGAAEVVIATDSDEIATAAELFGADVQRTSSRHRSGTDRIAEAASQRHWADDHIVVNVQGDEPLIPPSEIALGRQHARSIERGYRNAVRSARRARADCGSGRRKGGYSLRRRRTVLFSCAGALRARYQCRKGRFRFIGDTLACTRFASKRCRDSRGCNPCAAEQAEHLEQLRALHHGLRIRVAECTTTVPAGIDTSDDLIRVRRMLEKSAVSRLLFVCLGNICRSPSAQGVVEHLIEQRGWSDRFGRRFGRHRPLSHIGEPPDRRAIHAARQRGVDISGQRARSVDIGDFQTFDYIFAMDDSNLGDLRRLAPKDRHDRLYLMMAFAPESGYREVPDPYYGEAEGF